MVFELCQHRFVSGFNVINWCDYLADANDIPAVIDSPDFGSDKNYIFKLDYPQCFHV
jgi:hypothetical protein